MTASDPKLPYGKCVHPLKSAKRMNRKQVVK